MSMKKVRRHDITLANHNAFHHSAAFSKYKSLTIIFGNP